MILLHSQPVEVFLLCVCEREQLLNAYCGGTINIKKLCACVCMCMCMCMCVCVCVCVCVCES